jgi:hypothetical protein
MLESESKANANGGQIVPREVSKDSTFPFKSDQKLKVRIYVENKRLVMEKL